MTLRFDELPFQSVDGLEFNGVRFDFKLNGEDSPEAYYNSFGPGTLEFVVDPSLTGDSRGILSVDFFVPTSQISFGVALNSSVSLEPGFTVELYDASQQLLSTTSVNTMAGTGVLGFSEGEFNHNGLAVSRAVIDFADGPGSFAFDNLTFVVPEPSGATTAMVCLITILTMGIVLRMAKVTVSAPRRKVLAKNDLEKTLPSLT